MQVSKMYKYVIIIFFMINLSSLMSSNLKDTNITFSAGLDYFSKAQYEEALDKFEHLEKFSNDPNLYYNIGTCHYQLNNIGKAVLYYKRGLLLDSSNQRIRDALASIEEQIINTDDYSQSFLNRLIMDSYNYLSLNRLAWLTLFCIFLFGLMLFLSLSSKLNISVLAKRFYLTFSVFLLASVVTISFIKYISFKNNDQIVIIEDKTIIKKADENRVLLTQKKLKAGTTLKYLGQKDDNSIVALPNGERILIDKDSYSFVKAK